MGHYWRYSKFMGRKPFSPSRDPFGAWLLVLRRQKKLSQWDVADGISDLMGRSISAGQVSQWERLGNLTGRFVIPSLAETLGVSVEHLLQLKRTPTGYQEILIPTDLKIAVEYVSKFPIDRLTECPDTDHRFDWTAH